MKYGWVNTNLLDLWTSPRFNSERASQLFFGEPVRINREKGGFYSVTQMDDYKGWADARFVEIATKADWDSYTRRMRFVVASSTARLYAPAGHISAAPYFLYYGTKLVARSVGDGYARIILPGKCRMLVKMCCVRPINNGQTNRITGKLLIAEARRFLGVPYLWGGVTTAGFDCSGFVKTVLSRYGICLPRDTKDQISAGEKIDRNCIRTGDLLFFRRHVGFAVGKDRVIHASVGGGGVRINSLTPGKPEYRQDLDHDFDQARRILCFS